MGRLGGVGGQAAWLLLRTTELAGPFILDEDGVLGQAGWTAPRTPVWS